MLNRRTDAEVMEQKVPRKKWSKKRESDERELGDEGEE